MSHSTPLTDPRDMRIAIDRAARLGESLNGKPAGPFFGSGAIAQAARLKAMARGLSGEDHMTVLAYHALLRLESVTHQFLCHLNSTPPTRLAVAIVAAAEGRSIPAMEHRS